jgi:hypothetical protein
LTVLNHTPRNMSAPPVEPEAEPLYAPTITISTVVSYRGRQFTITSEGYTVEQFADLLDRKFGPPSAPAAQPSAPLCAVHNRTMKPMQRPDRQGHTYMCTAKIGDGWCDQRA